MVFIVESKVPNQLMPKAASKTEMQWVQLGIEYRKAKATGVNGRAFAESKGIKYETFTRQMSKYSSKIALAYKADQLSKKPTNKLTAAERKIVLINSFRSSIREKMRNDGAAVNNKSEKWFRETLAKGVRGHQVSKPQPGRIYAYMYDAKNKDTLPFWDKYPLIIFLGTATTKAGNTIMHGLNLHYIPPKARQQFLESLLEQYASTATITNSTRLKIDWSKVKGFQGADKMIKAYLPSHIRGRIIEVKPADWSNVVLLPLQQFVSKGKRFSATKVWSS